jgi:hypothetical protein
LGLEWLDHFAPLVGGTWRGQIAMTPLAFLSFSFSEYSSAPASNIENWNFAVACSCRLKSALGWVCSISITFGIIHLWRVIAWLGAAVMTAWRVVVRSCPIYSFMGIGASIQRTWCKQRSPSTLLALRRAASVILVFSARHDWNSSQLSSRASCAEQFQRASGGLDRSAMKFIAVLN